MLDYDKHYKNLADASPRDLYFEMYFLRGQKRFADIERAITAYLRYHGKRAEPWMYNMLAVALRVNKRDPAQVKAALGQAGYLAKQLREPMQLVKAADGLMLLKLNAVDLPDGTGGKITVRTDELLDLALNVAPHRPEPALLSMQLAEQNQDGPRMGDALERLLSLGWPGYDEFWRIEAHRRAVALAKQLRQGGDPAEAKALLDRLSASESRDLYVRVTWEGDAWLTLAVAEPLGANCNHATPRTVFGGSIVKDSAKDHEAIYVCPRGFSGKYSIRVEVVYNDEKKPVPFGTVEVITHEGTPQESKSVHKVGLTKLTPIVVELKGGRRTKVLPYSPRLRLEVSDDDLDEFDDMPKPGASPKAKAQPAAKGGETSKKAASKP